MGRAVFTKLSPITFSLKAHDVQALQALSSRVSVIPIIAKGDTLTKREKKLFKEKVPYILKLVFFSHVIFLPLGFVL